MSKLRILSTILFVIAILGFSNNSNNGTPESFYAYVIAGICGIAAAGIEIYLWLKNRKIKEKIEEIKTHFDMVYQYMKNLIGLDKLKEEKKDGKYKCS